jgi:hypothetical protein
LLRSRPVFAEAGLSLKFRRTSIFFPSNSRV